MRTQGTVIILDVPLTEVSLDTITFLEQFKAYDDPENKEPIFSIHIAVEGLDADEYGYAMPEDAEDRQKVKDQVLELQRLADQFSASYVRLTIY